MEKLNFTEISTFTAKLKNMLRNTIICSLFFSFHFLLLGQGLTLQNSFGKTIVIPEGKELTLFSQERGGRDLIEIRGKVLLVTNDKVELNIQFMEKTVECDQPESQVQSLLYKEYLPNRNFNVSIPTIDRIVVSKKSESLESIGAALIFLGGIASIIVAPTWGLIENSEKPFLKSTPGTISLIGSGAIITGTTIALIGNRKKTYHFDASTKKKQNGKSWKIIP